MKRGWGIFALGCFLAAPGLTVRVRSSPALAADTIVVHAKIYTVNSLEPWAEALAIRDGTILAVGKDREIERFRGPSTRVIDARGHLLLPGFTDSHIHFLAGSLSLRQVNLEGAGSVAEIQRRLKTFAAAHPQMKWILGRGWSYEDFGSSTLPNRKIIDAVIPDRPVFLVGFDGHTTWANSKALALAGITRSTPDPPNGIIVRDPRTGEPTGALKESAGALVERLIPQPTRREKLAALREGMALANRVGLVQVYSAGGDFDSLDLFDELRREGRLTLRMYFANIIPPPALTPAEIRTLEEGRRRYHDRWLAGGAAKFFLDGVIETHTAAMLAPYSDDPSLRGKLFWDPAKYKQAVAELDRRGFQIFTHAIGDRSVRLALDAYARAHELNHTADSRDRVEHIETVSAEDIPRFAQLGVIASMQPLHAYPDLENDIWIRNVGPDRETRAFAWRSIERAGGRLAFGSDWPVVTLNPWPGVQTALTRQTAEGRPPGGWVPAQRISLADTIRAYTLGAAYAGRREKWDGSLVPGKVADLILISPNLFKIDPHQIDRTKVLLTMVGGKIVYHAAGWPPEPAKPPLGKVR